MLSFKRVLHLGMHGPDVKAVKIGLKRARHSHGLVLTHHFGPATRTNLKRFQTAEKVKADGIYGPETHKLLEPHFSAYARWLYRRTKVEAPKTYVNPFSGCTKLQVGRIDMGVDYHGDGPIKAIGAAVIVGFAGAGWPGGEYLLYQLLEGEMKGHYVYIAEGIVPLVRAGQHVRAGEVICRFAGGYESEVYPGIETGWGSPTPGLTRAAEIGETGGFAHADSPPGLAFARFLKSIGAPAPATGFGPIYV